MDLSQFQRLADKRLDKVKEDYLPQYMSMINELFGSMPLDKAFAELYEVGSMPDIPVFTGKLDYLDQAPGYYTRIEPKEYAGAVAMTQRMIEDNQYGVFKNRQEKMVKAYGRTKEKAAVKAFGQAFSSSWDYMQSEENLSLCSSSHTTKAENVSTTYGFDNSGTSALSATSLAATRILFNKFRDDRGELYDSEPDLLLVPASLYDTALEITGYDPRSGATSQLDGSSANNKINTLYKGFKVVKWLRLDDYSTKNWFVVDSSLMKEMLLWIDRVEPQTNSRTDFDTFAVQQSIRGRFGWGASNWRFIYGHQVS
jgi:hypothetical protein